MTIHQVEREVVAGVHTAPFMRRAQAAAYVTRNYFPCSIQWLARLACEGGGPMYRKAGRFPVYEQIPLDEWARSRISAPVRSTSEYPMLGAA